MLREIATYFGQDGELRKIGAAIGAGKGLTAVGDDAKTEGLPRRQDEPLETADEEVQRPPECARECPETVERGSGREPCERRCPRHAGAGKGAVGP